MVSVPKKLSIEYVKQRVREISDCELLEDEYVNNRHKMRFRCPCGNEFESDFNHFQDQNRRRCTDCATMAQYEEKRLSLDDLQVRLNQYGCSYLSGTYRNQKSVIRILCACGHERGIRANSLNNTAYPFSGLCEKCSKNASSRKQMFTVTELAILANAFDLELLSDSYEGNTVPLQFKCRCGREFSASWNAVAQNGQTRCKVCSRAVSKGEKAVSDWLDAHGVYYVPQKRFLDCGGRRPYPFDFFLPNENICIEFDGEQHTRPAAFMGGAESFCQLKARDAKKDEYCEAHGIKLIRISYVDVKHIPEILSSTVIPR